MKKIFTHAGEGKRKIGCRFLPIWGKTGRRFGAASACGRCPGGPGGPGGPVERRSNEIALGRRLRSRDLRAFQRLLNEAALSGRCTGPPGRPGRPGQGLRRRFGAAAALVAAVLVVLVVLGVLLNDDPTKLRWGAV